MESGPSDSHHPQLQSSFGPLALRPNNAELHYPFLPFEDVLVPPQISNQSCMEFLEVPWQDSFDASTLFFDNNISPSWVPTAQDFEAFQQYSLTGATDSLFPSGVPAAQQLRPRYSAGKRAPKAPTLNAKRWKPYEGRIEQLYVRDGKSIGEVREIINREAGFTAT